MDVIERTNAELGQSSASFECQDEHFRLSMLTKKKSNIPKLLEGFFSPEISNGPCD